MAYETGTASGINNLLSKLATFIGANMTGWTIDKNSAATVMSTSGYWLTVHKNSVYHTMLGYHPSGNHYVYTYLHTGFNGAGTPQQQSGRPLNAGLDVYGYAGNITGDAVNTYHFFSDGDQCCHVAIEISPNLYSFFGFGQYIDQTVSGNTVKDFIYSTFWSAYSSYYDDPWSLHNSKIGQGCREHDSQHAGTMVAYNDGVSTKFVIPTNSFSGTTTNSIQGYINLYDKWMQKYQIYGAGNFTNHSVLQPIPVMGCPSPNTANPRLVCYIPNVALCRLETYEIAQEITIGSDTWVVFPWRTKAASTKSTMNGYAFKKIV